MTDATRLRILLNPQTPDEERAVEHVIQLGGDVISSIYTMIERDHRRPIIMVAPDAEWDESDAFDDDDD